MKAAEQLKHLLMKARSGDPQDELTDERVAEIEAKIDELEYYEQEKDDAKRKGEL